MVTTVRCLLSPGKQTRLPAKMGAGASTSEEQDLEIFTAMREEYEKVKSLDEQSAFDAVKKVYCDKMAEIGTDDATQGDGAAESAGADDGDAAAEDSGAAASGAADTTAADGAEAPAADAAAPAAAK